MKSSKMMTSRFYKNTQLQQISWWCAKFGNNQRDRFWEVTVTDTQTDTETNIHTSFFFCPLKSIDALWPLTDVFRSRWWNFEDIYKSIHFLKQLKFYADYDGTISFCTKRVLGKIFFLCPPIPFHFELRLV